jgi:Na+-driven multidrug efflux pump
MGMLLVINTAIEGEGNYRVPLFSLTLGSLVKLLISAALIPNDSFNILAAPIGTAMSYALSFSISYLYLNRVKKIRTPIFKNLIFTVTFSSAALLVSNFFNKNISLENWFLKEVLTYSIFAFVYFTFIFIYFFLGKTRKKVYNCDKNPSNKLYI